MVPVIAIKFNENLFQYSENQRARNIYHAGSISKREENPPGSRSKCEDLN